MGYSRHWALQAGGLRFEPIVSHQSFLIKSVYDSLYSFSNRSAVVVDRAIESMIPINNRPATANSGHTSRFEADECIQSLVSRRC